MSLSGCRTKKKKKDIPREVLDMLINQDFDSEDGDELYADSDDD